MQNSPTPKRPYTQKKKQQKTNKSATQAFSNGESPIPQTPLDAHFL